MQTVLSKARTIPPSFYTCPQHYREEIKKVFFNNWLHLGRQDQVQNVGDYFAGTFARQPFMVTRSAKGLQAFDNVCRHHGTILTKGAGVLPNKCITCGYHGWTYDLDGRLTKATRLKGIEDFKAKDYGLHALPVKTLGPTIFLYFGDANADERDKKFVKIDLNLPGLKYVVSKTYNVNCNWKVYVDNYIDGGYHIEYAHKNLASRLDMSSYTTKVFDRYATQTCACSGPVANTQERFKENPKYWWIYPNFMLNLYSDWLHTTTVIPVDVERSQILFEFYYRGDTVSDEMIKEELDACHPVEMEDEDLSVKVQEGMHSRFFKYGRYVPQFEESNYMFHDLLLKDMGMRWP